MRRLIRVALITAAALGALTVAAVVLLVVLNGQDPYGGPMESPSDS